MQFDDFSLQVIVLWDIDVSSVKDDTIFKVPVLQTFDESAWSVVQDGFKCFADFRVIRLGILNALPYRGGFQSDGGRLGDVD